MILEVWTKAMDHTKGFEIPELPYNMVEKGMQRLKEVFILE